MPLEGKGFFIWKIKECEGGDVEAIATLAAQAGLSHVLVKVADGTFTYNFDYDRNVDLVVPLVQALRARGIEVWGWHYVYGDAPLGEARKGIQRVRDLALDGYVIDAESEYKEPGKKDAAVRYMRELRSSLDNVPIALSSYRFPSYHPQLPWRQFLDKCDLNMPQVYWEFSHNPGVQLRRSLREFQEMTPNRPVIPTGAAYSRGNWGATANDVQEFLGAARELNLTAANFWEWSKARTAALSPVWEAIGAFPWGGGPIPSDIVELYFEALNAQDPQQAVALYGASAAHVTASHTKTGLEAIRGWYQHLFHHLLPQAAFTLSGFSGSGSSRQFSWTAVSPRGRVEDGNDVFGLLDGKIVYHYSFFTISGN